MVKAQAAPVVQHCAEASDVDVTKRMLCLPTGDRKNRTLYGRHVRQYDVACEAAVTAYKDQPTEELLAAAKKGNNKRCEIVYEAAMRKHPGDQLKAIRKAQDAKVRWPRMLKVSRAVASSTAAFIATAAFTSVANIAI